MGKATAKMKIGRNTPCPCKSGKKYKRCCGGISNSKKASSRALSRDFLVQFEKHKIAETVRQQQQGLGKPILSAVMGDRQIVAVGNTIYHSSQWKTFPDFLSYYVKTKLDPAWGNQEIAKPYKDRHPILQWYDQYCRFQQKHIGNSGQVKSAPITGIVTCYMGLAYNLYLLDHNAELQARLIKRLKNPKQFQGAYYEIIVAGILIRAGYELKLEDETDSETKHCEFSATSKLTGKKYWIEAKSRAVAGILGKTEADGSTNKDPTSMMTTHINEALKKPSDSDRMIFVDLNTPPEPGVSEPSWVSKVYKRLEAKEKDLPEDKAAYVYITNMAFHHAPDAENIGAAVAVFGLGIADFAKPGMYRLIDMYKNKQKHIDAYNIVTAITSYTELPATFDGKLPSEAFGKQDRRFVKGEKYFFADIGEGGIAAEVTSISVSEHEKCTYIAVLTDSGESLILKSEMTDDELADYRRHPEAFLGQVSNIPRHPKTPYELFEVFVGWHQSYSKDQLLELIKGHADISELKKLSQAELVLIYCERMVISVEQGKRKNES